MTIDREETVHVLDESSSRFENAASAGLADRVWAIFDNPIFVKHRRTRLRKSLITAPLAVVFVICILIAYSGYSFQGFTNGMVFSLTMIFQAILLAVIGATQIGSSVGAARESGIIDYHRVSPLSPLSLVLGFFFGAPVREYAMYAMTLPLALICIFNEAPGALGFFEATVALFLSAWTMHALALLTSLSTKKPKAGGRGVIGLVIFVAMFGGNAGIFVFRSAATSLNTGLKMGFFGIDIHWLLFTTLYTAPFLFFVLLASVRKMRSERAHPFTKPEAIGAIALLAFLLIGAVWGSPALVPTAITVLYVMVATSCVLITTVTPNQSEFAKGVRRALKEGRGSLGPWSDWAINRATVLVLAAILLLAGTIVTQALPESPGGRNFFNSYSPPEFSLSITVATSVFVVIYVGLAFQAFHLLMAKRASTMFALFLFMVWVVPLLVGAISGASGIDEGIASFIASLSPIAGISLSAGISGLDSTRLLQAGAFCPAIFFAFVFNNLVMVSKRRLEKKIRDSEEKPEEKPVALEV
ncbi:MAG: hypothetical protein SFX72_01095 [Isosphaeraceae bacterium]|nr:hypothetical protein [Isosphaeraceae bacterium]